PPRRGRRPAFEATPIYDAGRLYLSTPHGSVIALNAETGTEVWRVELNVADGNYGDFANRGVTLDRDRLYVATVDARLACLQKDGGARCAGFGRDGIVDLTQGLRLPPEWLGEYGVTSPPAIYRDLLIVGSSI